MQKFIGRVVDAKGVPVTGVSIQVNVAASSAAAIFSDNGVTAKANPLINAPNGTFEFYAADGRYDVVPSKAGMTLTSLLDFALADPATGDVLVLDRDVTAQDVVNTTTPTAAYTFSVPAGTLGSTRSIRMRVIGDWLQNTGVNQQTPTITIAYGGTTVLTLASFGAVGSSASRLSWFFDVLLSAANATNAQVAAGRLQFGQAGSAGGTMLSGPAVDAVGIHSALAVDGAVVQNLTVTITNPAAHAQYSTRVLAVQVERV